MIKQEVLRIGYNLSLIDNLKKLWERYCFQNNNYKFCYKNSISNIDIIYRDNMNNSHRELLNELLNQNTVQKMNLNNLVVKKEDYFISLNIKQAIEQIMSINKDYGNSIKSLITSFLVLEESDFVASTSPTFLGIVIIAPKKSWTIIDYIENIVHEKAHIELYMKQLIDPMVIGDIKLKSVFRNSMRPQNGVFHSCYVLSYIYLFYNIMNIKTPNIAANMLKQKENIRQKLELSITELNDNASLTEMGKYILNQMKNIYLDPLKYINDM